MGCDIHMRAEFLKENKWELIDEIFKNRYYDKDQPKTDWNREFTSEPYQGRNYDLFGILADVRNGRGFAGVRTGDRFNPIAEPKGIPTDASKEGLEFMNSYDTDGHSHSYFTVKELLDFDWNQKRGNITYKAECGSFCTEIIPILEKLGNPESVRIIFFFDN